MILTSGTTGTPKGAPRSEAGIDAAVALLSRMPLRAGWRCTSPRRCSTPGGGPTCPAMLLGSTLVLRRRFDPEDCLAPSQTQAATRSWSIPVMLQRILELPEETLDALRPVRGARPSPSSGSALPGDLATGWMDRFGDNLYNVYGSTEVA